MGKWKYAIDLDYFFLSGQALNQHHPKGGQFWISWNLRSFLCLMDGKWIHIFRLRSFDL